MVHQLCLYGGHRTQVWIVFICELHLNTMVVVHHQDARAHVTEHLKDRQGCWKILKSWPWSRFLIVCTVVASGLVGLTFAVVYE
jgi:hypothetical protein